MTTTLAYESRPEIKRYCLVIQSVIALGVTLYLFYIDEGTYSFKGMLRPANLVALFAYFSIFLGFQVLFDLLILRRIARAWRVPLVLLLGTGLVWWLAL